MKEFKEEIDKYEFETLMIDSWFPNFFSKNYNSNPNENKNKDNKNKNNLPNERKVGWKRINN